METLILSNYYLAKNLRATSSVEAFPYNMDIEFVLAIFNENLAYCGGICLHPTGSTTLVLPNLDLD